MTFTTIQQIRKRLRSAMTADRRGIRHALDRLEREQTRLQPKEDSNQPGEIDSSAWKKFQSRLNELAQRVNRSAETAKKRRAKIKPPKYDPELPIVEHREKIAELIKKHPVVIVCGETGSGKSTQLPKICLELGRGIYGMIGHTQPRRIAARSIARRLADELGTDLGDGVGFKIRFTDTTADTTLVKVMTDGVLLAESQSDPYFEKYDTIIIDEAHERSLNIDFLLGMMKRIIPRRRDFRLIITSATIDAKRFSEHFAFHGVPAPIVEVSGRTYPIKIVYRPLDEFADEEEEENTKSSRRNPKKEDDSDLKDRALVAAVEECARHGSGDMLIFMPKERDILDAAKLLAKQTIPGDDAARKSEILPLFARLTFDEQKKIFEKSSRRKIVIATNVAESSLTVPGIRYVIDTGTARMSRYSARSRTQRLPVEPVSRASADQRAGRCGRIGPGYCIRLYSQEDYRSRDEFTTPEIRRTNLASVILRTIALGLGQIEKFPFLDAPSRGTIADGYKTLFELGAIDADNCLTPIGRKLSRLPVDPRIGRMILAAEEEGVLPDILTLAAALEIQDPRERPIEKAAQADAAHAQFSDETSDFLGYLKIWDLWRHWKETLSVSKTRKACAENFLSFNRMREWADTRSQLARLAAEIFRTKEAPAFEIGPTLSPEDRIKKSDALHRAVLSGLLIGIAQKSDAGDYNAALGGKFVLWPGSGLAKKKPMWVVAAERVETSRRFLRGVGRINPAWIESLAGHLLDKTCHEPHWCRETGYVHAYQRISLFGLTLVPKRRVNFGPLEPAKARDIFIQRALVEGDFDCSLDFFVRNQAELEKAVSAAAKLRAPDFVRGEIFRYTFYQERISDTVYDAPTLKKWYKTLSPAAKKRLEWSYGDLCKNGPDEAALAQFPDTLDCDSGEIPIQYRYEPGADDDGLTAVMTPDQFAETDIHHAAGWLVPGLLEARMTALLKSLPKDIRRRLVPIPETSKAIIREISFGDGDFFTVLCRQASRLAGQLITPADFDRTKIPAELSLNLRILDDAGQTIAEGRNIEAITETIGVQARRTLETYRDDRWFQDGLTGWAFGSLPESAAIQKGGRSLTAYPGLCDGALTGGAEGTVSLRLFETGNEAQAQTRIALVRLFYQAARRDLKTQADWLPEAGKLRAIAATLPDFPFNQAVGELIARRAIDSDSFVLPRSEGDYNRLIAAGKQRIGLAATEITFWIKSFLEAYQSARLAIEKHRQPMFTEVRSDCRQLFERLLFSGFYRTVPWNWLKEYPRYFKAIAVRYEAVLSGKGVMDRRASEELRGLWDDWEMFRSRHEEAGIYDPELETYRWMIEEYTVSLYAQKLGTAMKVSAVRLEKQRETIIGG